MVLKPIWSGLSVKHAAHVSSSDESDVSTSNPSSSPWISDVQRIYISLVSYQDNSVVHSFSVASNNTISVWAPSLGIEGNWNCSQFEMAEMSFFVLGNKYVAVGLSYSMKLSVSALSLSNLLPQNHKKISKSRVWNSKWWIMLMWLGNLLVILRKQIGKGQCRDTQFHGVTKTNGYIFVSQNEETHFSHLELRTISIALDA